MSRSLLMLFLLGTCSLRAPGQQSPAAAKPAEQPGASSAKPDAATSAPKLKLSQAAWDFGEVWHGAKPSFTLVITNEGTAPLSIVKVAPSCGCTAATPEKSTLGPGESTNVNIAVDTHGKQGAFTSSVSIITNDKSNAGAKLDIRGTVKRAVTIDPIGGLFVRGTDPKARLESDVTITNHEAEPMRLELENYPSDQWDLEIREVEPGRKYIVHGKTKKDLPYGMTSLSAQFKTGITREPTLSVPISTTIYERVSLSPRVIYLPSHEDEPGQPRDVKVYYYGDAAFQVSSISSDNAMVTATAQPTRGPQSEAQLKPAPKAVVDMTVKVPAGKDVPAGGIRVTLKTNDPDYSAVTLLITSDADEYRKVMFGTSSGPTSGAK